MIQFPYYSGNIKNSRVLGHVSLDDFIKKHKEPHTDTLKILSSVEDAVLKGDLEEKKRLKTQLYSFTPSIIVNIGERRIYKNIVEFTGLMQIDLDGIPTEQEATDLKEHIFHEHEELVCCYLSPSKRGIKALMRIVKPKDVAHYKALHKGVAKEFLDYGYFDTATKNPILPLFLSYDKDILYRPFNKAEVWFKSEWEKKTYFQLNDAPTTSDRTAKDYEKVVRILTTTINEITDNGHPQVVRASLILGSRVGAGYLTTSDARYLIENLIKNNNYLSKGTAGYVKTAMWGIDNGINNPKFYK
jgi:hypothetical protein